MRLPALTAFILALCAVLSSPARSASVAGGYSDTDVAAAFEKLLDDPFFERFTGLTIYDRTSLSRPDRRIGGSQSFRFDKFCVTETITETPKESKTTESRYNGVYEVTRRWTEKETRTERTNEVHYLSYMPTLEISGNGANKLYCEAGEFGNDPGKGVNPFLALGGMATAISKGITLGVIGGKTWSSTKCNWSPFDPDNYASWIERKWLNWRLQQFLPGGEDKLVKAFDLFGKKKYDEALPRFQELADHFGYTRKEVPKWEKAYKVWPYAYSSDMPEIFAILGDIYRLHLKDMAKAEEHYRIAYSVGGSPFLEETAGIARANRGMGLTMAERARTAARGADKELFEQLGAGAAFHLYAYLGFYKDRVAPDRDEVMKMIKEIDPDAIRDRKKEVAARQKMEQDVNDFKAQKEKVKAIMEY